MYKVRELMNVTEIERIVRNEECTKIVFDINRFIDGKEWLSRVTMELSEGLIHVKLTHSDILKHPSKSYPELMPDYDSVYNIDVELGDQKSSIPCAFNGVVWGIKDSKQEFTCIYATMKCGTWVLFSVDGDSIKIEENPQLENVVERFGGTAIEIATAKLVRPV